MYIPSVLNLHTIEINEVFNLLQCLVYFWSKQKQLVQMLSIDKMKEFIPLRNALVEINTRKYDSEKKASQLPSLLTAGN